MLGELGRTHNLNYVTRETREPGVRRYRGTYAVVGEGAGSALAVGGCFADGA